MEGSKYEQNYYWKKLSRVGIRKDHRKYPCAHCHDLG
jgi:hypothetical protein